MDRHQDHHLTFQLDEIEDHILEIQLHFSIDEEQVYRQQGCQIQNLKISSSLRKIRKFSFWDLRSK